MIISHKHKFIFVKTRKTAGTSIEMALSQFCGDEDVITPIAEKDELKRQESGFRGPQNCRVPLRYASRSELLGIRKRKQFFNHASAEFIRDNIESEVWNSYFKFCFERNPFDKAISRYYWSAKEPRPPMAEYLNTAPIGHLSNWGIYTINDHIAVDFVGRYENLDADLATVAEKIGLTGELTLPRAKGGFRKDRRHYSETLDAESRARIELVCAKEITALGYPWQAQDSSTEETQIPVTSRYNSA